MVNEHGGNIYGKDIRLDFSANLNPLGMPASVKNAAAGAVCECDRYPDPFCRKLTEKLSALCAAEVQDLKMNTPMPLLVVIPDRHGTSDMTAAISRYLAETVGIHI